MNAIRTTVRAMIAILIGAGVLSMAHAQVKPAQPTQNVVLVELFTSEGCSSCPPADDLLRKVNETQTTAGQLVVGISEHVTYWDHLGWKDPYSSSTYTDRQERYANRFRLDGPYTPQMVVNGEQQFVGSNELQLSQALASEAKRPGIDLRIRSSELHNNTLAVRFTATRLLSTRPLNIVAVLANDVTSSKVLRGENSGRSLQHVAVARSLTTVATIHGDTDLVVTIPVSATDDMKKGTRHHVILFAQEPRQGVIVGTDEKPVTLTSAF